MRCPRYLHLSAIGQQQYSPQDCTHPVPRLPRPGSAVRFFAPTSPPVLGTGQISISLVIDWNTHLKLLGGLLSPRPATSTLVSSESPRENFACWKQQTSLGSQILHGPHHMVSNPDGSLAGIHKACSRKLTDLKVDSFQTLFVDAFPGVYVTFYRTDLST